MQEVIQQYRTTLYCYMITLSEIQNGVETAPSTHE